MRSWLENTKLPSSSRFFKLLGCLNQQSISPGVIRLRNSLYDKYPYKDVPGGWKVKILVQENGYSIVHEKSEQSYNQAPTHSFSLNWAFTIKFSPYFSNVWAGFQVTGWNCGPDMSPELRKDFEAIVVQHTPPQIMNHRLLIADDQSPRGSLLLTPKLAERFRVAYAVHQIPAFPASDSNLESPLYVLMESLISKLESEENRAAIMNMLESLVYEVGHSDVEVVSRLLSYIHIHNYRSSLLFKLLHYDTQAHMFGALKSQLSKHLPHLVDDSKYYTIEFCRTRQGYKLVVNHVSRDDENIIWWSALFYLDERLSTFDSSIVVQDVMPSQDLLSSSSASSQLLSTLEHLVTPTSVFSQKFRCLSSDDLDLYFESTQTISNSLSIFLDGANLFQDFSINTSTLLAALKHLEKHISLATFYLDISNPLRIRKAKCSIIDVVCTSEPSSVSKKHLIYPVRIQSHEHYLHQNLAQDLIQCSSMLEIRSESNQLLYQPLPELDRPQLVQTMLDAIFYKVEPNHLAQIYSQSLANSIRERPNLVCALSHFFQEQQSPIHLSDNKPQKSFKLFSLLTRNTLCQAMLSLRDLFYDKFHYKSVKGSWSVTLHFLPNKKTLITHSKQEQTPCLDDFRSYFFFEWRLQLTVDLDMETIKQSQYIHNLFFHEETSEETRTDVIMAFSPIIRDSPCAFLNMATSISTLEIIELLRKAIKDAHPTPVEHSSLGTLDVTFLLQQLERNIPSKKIPITPLGSNLTLEQELCYGSNL
ncbi:uncharacterized protein LOC126316680 [Schistocerca gregaria]|uniref:uncharacterized protein LOC126316680 n=1 Tax=Schistocerca gregaria TaxID=7010 RepID=UPI00211F0429|nr:uncharacterized protein LOC126316680 [Schistocerca gregaria]